MEAEKGEPERSGRILVVEDDGDFRDILSDLLEAEGYVVAVAVDGEEGLARARELRPEAILCDVVMPGRDGYRVCEDLGTDPATAGIPVLFLTARGEPLDRYLAYRAGGKAYLPKPVPAEEILSTLKRVLGRA
jgi:CheY-like chemotaxis protein